MEQDQINFAQAWALLRRRAPLIVFCAVVVGAAAFGYTKSQQKEYTATASLVFTKDSLGSQITGLVPITSGAQLAQQASNVDLVELGNSAATTARLIGNGLSEADVRKSIEVAGQGESNVVAVSATSTSPRLAAAIATTYSHAFVKQRQKENEQFFNSALGLVNAEIARLPSDQEFGPAAIGLQNRAQDLRLLKGLGYSDVRLAQRAVVPTVPSAPKTAKNTVIGILLGLLLGLGLAFLVERLDRDRRIREASDLEEIYWLPVLGAVPESPELAGAGRLGEGGAMSPAATEAFHLIRAQLRFTGVDRTAPRAIMVATAARGDGATTVARCLAEATAAMGLRVLLIEADFRNPTLATTLGLADRPGLSEVLGGSAVMLDAIQAVGLGTLAPDGKVRSLDVLPCGPRVPANPAELLEGERMEATLSYARSAYDLVVVDAPSLVEVSDAYSLLGQVDGVVVVSWVGRSRRDTATRLRQALVSSQAPQLGVIANRVKSRDLRAYSVTPRPAGSSPPAIAGDSQPAINTSANGGSQDPAPAPPPQAS